MKNYNKILEAINKGVKLAIDDYQDIEDNNSISGKSDIIRNENEIKARKNFWDLFVDLGLPSGTLSMKYNLGVNPNKLDNEEDWYGNYYAWGEIEEKPLYDKDSYIYSKPYEGNISYYLMPSAVYTKYNKIDCKQKLDLEDDAAYMNNPYKMFGNICTPTANQFDELLKYTIHDNTTEIHDYMGVRGLNGKKLKSIINGNEIFFPYSGIKIASNEFKQFGHRGYFMCSHIYPEKYDWAGYDLQLFDSGFSSVDTLLRKYGRPVRPVLMKK